MKGKNIVIFLKYALLNIKDGMDFNESPVCFLKKGKLE